jgi:amino acid permease
MRLETIPKKIIGLWEKHGDTIKTWLIIVIIVAAVYTVTVFVIWGLFQPTRAVIYGIAFVLFYVVFNRMIDKISTYRKEQKNADLIFKTREMKEKEAKEKEKEEKKDDKKEKKEEKDKKDD